MAKKPKKTEAKPAVHTEKDRKTLKGIRELAGGVADFAERGRSPYADIPSRSLATVRFNATKRFIEMGSGTNRRELFNLTQAKAYMQTLLVSSGCKELVDQGKTLSIRGLYYRLKHKIKPTIENTFEDQAECDPIIEDVEVLLNALREELHLYADKRGEMVGNIDVVDQGDEIDCSRMGSGGYGIPSICEPEIIELNPKRCDAEFVLHVEKGTVWQRFKIGRA